MPWMNILCSYKAISVPKLSGVIFFTKIELVGLFDEGEDILMSQLDSQEEDRFPATGHALVLKWFSCFSWVQQTDLNYLLLEDKSSNIASLNKDFITDPFRDCETPPPETASI